MSEFDVPEHDDIESESVSDAPAPTTAPSRTGRSISRWVVFIGCIALLPSILSVTGLAPSALNWVHPKLASVTTFDEVSLHWWAPVECRGVQIENTREWSREAPSLLTVRRIRTRQPLWKIALSLGRETEVTVEQPELTLLNSDEGSNLTEAISDLSQTSGSSQAHFPFRVAVTDGRILVAGPRETVENDTAGAYATQTLVSGIHCDVSALNPDSRIPDVSLVAVLGDAERSGSLSQRNALRSDTTVNPRVAARLDDLAADFQPLQLELPAHDSAGSDEPSLEIRLGADDGEQQRAMQFVARGLQLDVLEPLIAQLIPGIQCRGLVSVKGEAMMLGDTLSDGFALRGAVRAAKVAWRMNDWQPGESVRMSRGSADCAVAVAEDGLLVQTLSVNCPFASVRGDGEIRFPADQLLQGLLNPGENLPPQRNDAVAEAAAAAAGQVNIQGELDLVALSRMLPRTLHLREGLELQQGALKFAVKTQSEASDRDAANTLDWQAVVQTSPVIARHGRRTVRWDEPIQVRCSGPLNLQSVGLRSAVLAGDFGRLNLTPVQELIEVEGRISFDRLWNHLGQFIDGEAPGIRGDVQIDGLVGLPASGEIALRNVRLFADNLRVESDQLTVRTSESPLQMLDGQLVLTGSGSAVRSLLAPWTDLYWLAAESGISLQLNAAPPHRLTIVGEVQPGATASIGSASDYRSSTVRVSQAQLALDIDTDSTPGHYVIRSGRLRMPGANVSLSGTLDTTGPWMTSQLEIETDYDLAMLSRMVLHDPQENIIFNGRRKSRVSVQGTPAFWDGHGPQDAMPFEAMGEVAWDSATVYGLQIGPGTAPFRLRAGEIQTEPIRCTVNGGRLNAMFNYDLRRSQLALASGSRVEELNVDEELTQRWMGYMTPLLADAAGVRGAVSVRTDGFLYDLNQPGNSQGQGTMDVHGITASPGHSLTVLLQAVDTLRSGQRTLVRDLTVPEQRVRFDMRDGMIAHDRVLLELSGYQLQTRGAVGIDRQLALTLDVPLERSGEQQTGRSVSVPVRGTISRPSIDLQRLMQEAGGRRIQDEINEQLDRGFNRLFDKL